MSEKSATTYAVFYLRFKLRIPPAVLLAHSREAAAVIRSGEGLIWKIWVFEEEELEMGGMYLFANRPTDWWPQLWCGMKQSACLVRMSVSQGHSQSLRCLQAS